MSHYGRMTNLSFLADLPFLLIGVAVIVAVLRANRDDLPDLIYALMGRGRDRDAGRIPPSLPKPDDDDGPTPPSLPMP
jgi:hypothetical protein